ncbi:T6SS immunity protein Tli4 family protein [Paraburkholderia sp. BCC1876]|uniref:T6SS immunity protein Tli4 family protein n=1 Tax=Paraburkholderia sp. BCC1876 TaxID=2676303 RepID=UPI001FC803CE|nr:T6SS immunity protein Tli4 family protein [Paraburkholderia sp. BCC1876]
MLSKPRPWCIGRFVFDRPAASEISNQRYEYRGDTLETKPNFSAKSYQDQVSDLDKRLRHSDRVNPGTNAKTGHVWLEKAFSPSADAKVFVYREFDASSDLDFKTEGYFFDNGSLFHTSGGIGAAALSSVEDIYNDTYRRIKARDNWSVPTEAGFCFDGGIVTGSSTYTEEVSQSFALMPGRPVLLVIQMRDAVDADKKASLTMTLPQLRAQMDRLPGHYRILRQGKRTIAGMDAEEVLFELKEGDLTSYRFYLLAPGDSSTLAKPYTAIQLLLGASSSDLAPGQTTSPVDEAGALQTWDALLNTLRLRPGAV